MRLPATPRRFLRRTLAPLALAALASLGALAPLHAAEESSVATAARNAMWSGDFAALEKQNAWLKQPGRLAVDGSSDLDRFRSAIIDVMTSKVKNPEAYLLEIEALTLAWAKEHPGSALAHILHAEALAAHAWSYRGGGYARDVAPEAWDDFHGYLRRAVGYLHAHADVALTDSHAHVLLLKIGKPLGWDLEQMEAIRREGLKRNPEDIVLHFDVLRRLLPKWGGDPRALDDYIKRATEESRAQFGSGMYARLYATAADEEFGHALFEDSYAQWDTMKQSFEDMFARYPDSPKRRNNYAYMACLAKDRDTLLRVLGEIGKDVDLSSWGRNPERTLERCRSFAGKV